MILQQTNQSEHYPCFFSFSPPLLRSPLCLFIFRWCPSLNGTIVYIRTRGGITKTVPLLRSEGNNDSFSFRYHGEYHVKTRANKINKEVQLEGRVRTYTFPCFYGTSPLLCFNFFYSSFFFVFMVLFFFPCSFVLFVFLFFS